MYIRKEDTKAIVSFYHELTQKAAKKEILTSNLKQNRGVNVTRIRGNTVRKMQEKIPERETMNSSQTHDILLHPSISILPSALAYGLRLASPVLESQYPA